MTQANENTSDLTSLYVLVLTLTVLMALLMPNFDFSVSRHAVDRLEMPNLIVVLYVLFLLPTPYLLHREMLRVIPQTKRRRDRMFRWIRLAVYRVIIVGLVTSPLFYTLASSRTMFETYPIANEVAGIEGQKSNSRIGSILLAAISDTHITDQERTLEGQGNGPQKLKKTLQVLSSANPKVSLLLGDSTDRGEEAEWQLLLRILFEQYGRQVSFAASQPVLVVPGNHDIHGPPLQIKATEASLMEQGVFGEEFVQERSVRRLISYFTMAQSLKLPTRAPGDEGITANGIPELFAEVLKDASKRKVSVPAADPYTGRATVFIDYPEGFGLKLKRAIEPTNEVFPISYIDPASGLAIILMNSSAKPRSGTSMGLGDLGRDQLKRFEKMLAGLRENSKIKILVVALHHAAVKRSTDSWSWYDALKRKTGSDIFEHTYLALDPGDAEELLDQLSKFAAAKKKIPIVIAHGHRHGEPFVGRTEHGIWVMEAPAVIEDKTPPETLGIEALSTDVFALVLLGENYHVVKRWVLNMKSSK